MKLFFLKYIVFSELTGDFPNLLNTIHLWLKEHNNELLHKVLLTLMLANSKPIYFL